MPDSPGRRKYDLCQVWLEFLSPFLWKLELNYNRMQNMNYKCRSWAISDLLSHRLAQQDTWPLRFWSLGWTWRMWSPSNKQMCTPWHWSSGKWHLAVMASEVSAISFLLSESTFGQTCSCGCLRRGWYFSTLTNCSSVRGYCKLTGLRQYEMHVCMSSLEGQASESTRKLFLNWCKGESVVRKTVFRDI